MTNDRRILDAEWRERMEETNNALTRKLVYWLTHNYTFPLWFEKLWQFFK